MASTIPIKPKSKFRTIAEVQERLGHIPESRILSFPAPGTATVQDLVTLSFWRAGVRERPELLLHSNLGGLTHPRSPNQPA